jgi:hypothetical protein
VPAAARGGHTFIAELLLKHRAPVNAPDHSGMAPLFWAVQSAQVRSRTLSIGR